MGAAMSKWTKRARNRPPPPTAGKDWIILCPHADACHRHVVSWSNKDGTPMVHRVIGKGGVPRDTPYLMLCEACYAATGGREGGSFVIGDVVPYSEAMAARVVLDS